MNACRTNRCTYSSLQDMLSEVLGGGVRYRYVFEHAFEFARELTAAFCFKT